MHSLKNTVVAILLLGVSYGVYQVITAPERLTTADQDLIDSIKLDDGLSVITPADEASQPEVQLPVVAPAPANSSSLPGSRNTAPANPVPPREDQAASPQASDNSTFDPKTESLVNRQANLDFDGEPDLSGQLASAEFEDGVKNVARDQELIDALKEQLESNDEVSSPQSDFAPPSNGEMVSVISRPEAAPTTISENQPDANLFAPASPVAEPQPTTKAVPPKEPATVEPMSAIWPTVETMAKAGKFRTALETLTPYFGAPDLSDIQRQRLMGWLDGLAGKVIYSAEHNLNKPYLVQANESLDEIAKRWNVTSQLVYNINKANVDNPTELTPGTELKMVQGPFHAEIDLTNKVMTLFVTNLYAGRFTIQVDDNSAIAGGQTGVKQKTVNGTTAAGQPVAYMIELENGACIQAISETSSNPSCIGLSSKDAADLFTIFTEQSQFFIKR